MFAMLQVFVVLLLFCSKCGFGVAPYSGEINLNKRISYRKMKLLIEIYDKAATKEWSLRGVIPYWKCAVPWYKTYGNNRNKPYHCHSSNNTFWCSMEKKYTGPWIKHANCIIKADDVAHSSWKAPDECSPLFIVESRYYKGCVQGSGKMSWCSHEIEYKLDGEWSYCRIDGSWSPWNEWSVCSKSCGGGIQFTNRTCNNPKPQYKGKLCQGAANKSQICNEQICPTSDPLKKQSTSGISGIVIPTILSIGALIVCAAIVIGILVYRRRRKGRPESLSSTDDQSVLYRESSGY